MKDEILLVSLSPLRYLASHWHWFALAGIIFLAAVLRLYRLDTIPPGLHYDEAFNAIQAREVLRGTNRPIFFTGNFGEEPMQMYVEAVVFALAGESPLTARLSNVLLGLLLIPALYFCARAFFPKQPFVALASPLIGATLYWAINFSRLGIETNSLPWILTFSAGALVLANERRDWRTNALAGILTGTVVYTYLASRLWPFAVALWLGYLILFHSGFLGLFRIGRGTTSLLEYSSGKQIRPGNGSATTDARYIHLKRWLVVAAFGALTVAPLAFFFLSNPVAVTGRAGQVLTPDQFGTNLLRTAGMFFFAGDADPRDNLPGRPALDPFLGLLFSIGLVVTAARAKEPAYAFILIWFVTMTLPSALTEFAPNFRRAIGALPAVVLICGIGAAWIWDLRRRIPKFDLRISGWAIGGLLLLGFSFSAWASARDYFESWARGTGLYYSFDAGLLEVARTLAARPANEQLCLSPDYSDHPTVLWAMDGRAYTAFDGRRAAVLPDSALPATCAIITHEDQTFSLAKFYPAAQPLGTIYDLERKPYAQIFHLPAGATPILQPQHPLDARVGEAVRVLGYDLARQGEHVELAIYWRAEGIVHDDYTVFVHLLGPPNPASDSPIWSQDDAQPGHDTYATSRWRAGQTVIDYHSLNLPESAPPANYQLEVGMYMLSTGARLKVWLNGQAVAGDRLLLGDITK